MGAYPDFDKQTLMEHAESVNQSLGALPLGAIENKYVWTVGTEYDAASGASKPAANLKDDAGNAVNWMTYPKDWKTVKTTDPVSTPVDQLEYGLCMFIQIENPGVQKALKVQYFYNPKTSSGTKDVADLITDVVSGQTSGFNTPRINDAANKQLPDDPLYLVTVQDLQLDRVWNPKDVRNQ